MSSKPIATFPDRSQWMELQVVVAPHPAVLATDDLLQACELRTQRRSGPGGQHRNKTSSGVFLTHGPTGIVGEATERRSQAQNRDVALVRLRYELALNRRTLSPLWQPSESDERVAADSLEQKIRTQYRGHSLRLNENNVDKPAVLAMLLNDLWCSGGQPSLVASNWNVSTSKLVSFLRSVPPAIVWTNAVRKHHGRLPLH